MDFSFSGIKTSAIKYISSLIEENGKLSEDLINDVCYNFQDTVVQQLILKLELAVNLYKPNNIIVCGGVAANSHLRSRIIEEFPISVIIPTPKLCTDNGSMIAAAAFHEGLVSNKSELDLDVFPSLRLVD